MERSRNQRRNQRSQPSTSRRPARVLRNNSHPTRNNVHILPTYRSNVRNDERNKMKINYGRVIGICLILYFVVWSILPITHRIEQRREMQKLNIQLVDIKKQNVGLRKEVDYMKTPEYVEQQARYLGLSRADEEVIVVIPQKKKSTPSTTEKPKSTSRNQDLKETFWSRVVSAFARVF